jgi:peroxiredoxin
MLLIHLLLACDPPIEALEPAEPRCPEGVSPGLCAPDFEAVDRDGNLHRFSDLAEGHVVMLSFGATWCVYCRSMAQEAEPLWASRADEGLLVIDVLIQDQEALPAQPDDAGAWADALDLSYPVLADPMGVTWPLYDPISAMPAAWIIDRDGVIQWADRGYVNSGELVPLIDDLLDDSDPIVEF